MSTHWGLKEGSQKHLEKFKIETSGLPWNGPVGSVFSVCPPFSAVTLTRISCPLRPFLCTDFDPMPLYSAPGQVLFGNLH